ncbi:hypothetical protein SAMN05428949_4153 [Chitinophaga sp. YR627]|uniref:hypothetical protein n=1 Tax=Chitinophaga sp. YR627 TaxID=1881041 RepID=UPI0008EA566A|nr:hypothetical protein [Chitinophaga sp. YR627]SFO02005.1 hypothetical protein SAMN05428949_4153 [Chitinophaga sp. YR627]
MNLALGAFILTLLFLPAISFRLAVNRLENLKGLLSALSITDSIWVFTVVPIFIHIIILLCFCLFNVTVKFDLILNIIYSNSRFTLNNAILGPDIIKFLGYNLLAIFLGGVLGFMINKLEMRWKLVSRLFGLGNEWYEAFEGDILNISGEQSNVSNIDLVYLDVLANTKEASILYSGILVKYYYKPKSTELDYIVLQRAVKRDLRKEFRSDKPHVEAGKASFYDQHTGDSMPVKGDYLIIPMKEVLNINITYLYFDIPEDAIDQLAE